MGYGLTVSTGIAARRGIIGYMTTKKEDDAKALLDRLGTERKGLEAKLDDVQKETHDAIVDILMARTLGPSEVARRVQYDRQHVARIAKKAGVPPLREATVVGRAKATATEESRPAAATAPRQEVAQVVPDPPDLTGIFPEVAALPYARIKELAETAEARQPKWVEEIRQEYPDADELRLNYLIVNVGFRYGRKPPELAAESRPRLRADRSVTAEEAAEFAVLARSRASEMQAKKLDQEAGKASDENKGFAVMHTALDMEVLKHDEVYGERPVSSEETSG